MRALPDNCVCGGLAPVGLCVCPCAGASLAHISGHRVWVCVAVIYGTRVRATAATLVVARARIASLLCLFEEMATEKVGKIPRLIVFVVRALIV